METFNTMYFGAFEKFECVIEEFLDEAPEMDCSYSLEGDKYGDVKFDITRSENKIDFIINDIKFKFIEDRVVFMNAYEAFRNRPYILYMMVKLFHQLYLDNNTELFKDKKDKVLDVMDAFLLLEGWFEDPRIEKAEEDEYEAIANERARENKEFWDEYEKFNPNDI